eukprot:CAMPEP_0194038384 /NCGR_PEP_ID=MMETSP0009_2-20130614/10621_1 /TAXON_ID=210454 /ORGANISM="Grammatophora oceanica, Strain CCMP 410" /LENGTH=93 /DNA_ID=CAMNT_0038680859 /DNA_START=258 /DNA_END=537 /DNA_ORIENTATION=+
MKRIASSEDERVVQEIVLAVESALQLREQQEQQEEDLSEDKDDDCHLPFAGRRLLDGLVGFCLTEEGIQPACEEAAMPRKRDPAMLESRTDEV